MDIFKNIHSHRVAVRHFLHNVMHIMSLDQDQLGVKTTDYDYTLLCYCHFVLHIKSQLLPLLGVTSVSCDLLLLYTVVTVIILL